MHLRVLEVIHLEFEDGREDSVTDVIPNDPLPKSLNSPVVAEFGISVKVSGEAVHFVTLRKMLNPDNTKEAANFDA